MSELKESASQTAGPYLHIGMLPAAAGIDSRRNQPGNVLGGEGERIRLEGVIYDGAAAAVRDAQIEIWQADGQGRYDDAGSAGFGRSASDFETGLWRFETVKPGAVPGRHGRPMAPHINALVFARGINIGLHTRIYFADEEAANAADPVLALIGPEARETLLARRQESGAYRFDIHLQGERETVFLDV